MIRIRKDIVFLRGLVLVCLLQFISLSFATAQTEVVDANSKKVKRWLQAAALFLERNQELRANFLPPDFNSSRPAAEITLEYLNSNQERVVTRLNSVKIGLVDFGRSLLWANDKENLKRLYRILYPKIPSKFRKKLDGPKVLTSKSLSQVRKAYLKLARTVDLNFDRIVLSVKPGVSELLRINPIGNCDLEIGAEWVGNDSESSARCALTSYEPTGLFLNTSFPLQDNLTCIKDQGNRGTCAAHAIAATAESLAMKTGSPPETLSEQFIYYFGSVEGDSQVNLYEMQADGMSPHLALDEMVRQRFGLYYENVWNYNQSDAGRSLTPNSGLGVFTYPNSCTSDYMGEECSDYTWQTISSVVQRGIPEPGQPPSRPANSAHRISSHAYLPGDGGGATATEYSLQNAVLLLAADVPLVITLNVTDDFKNSSNGYVRHRAGDAVLGSHAMELVGFVPNSALPAGVTAATREGYFIVKNSWGMLGGDCGFYYLDFAYVKAHVSYLDVISIS